MDELKGKIALITGASRGIGKEIALSFALLGIHVIVNYLNNREAAAQTAAQIETLGGKSYLIQCDVSKSAAVKKMIEQIEKDFGKN